MAKEILVADVPSFEGKEPPEPMGSVYCYKSSTNILLIAPHGVTSPPRDDVGTADLAEAIQKRLGCSAIINTLFRKPEGYHPEKRNGGHPDFGKRVLNLNIVEQAKQVPGYLNKIEEIAGSKGHTYVFWIHGIADGNITEGTDCFIGYGQPDNGQAKRFTAREETIQSLIKQFQVNGIMAVEAPTDSGYRGWDKTYMNQWCRRKGLPFETVQSIQLEFKKTGFRDEQGIEKAAGDIANAISALVQPEIEIKPTEIIEAKAQEPEMDTPDETNPDLEPDAKDDAITNDPVQSGDETEKGLDAASVPAPGQEAASTRQMTDEDDRTDAIDVGEATPASDVKNDAMKADDQKQDKDDPLVEEAYSILFGMFSKHYGNAMMEAGHYLIQTFYDDDIEKARNNQSSKEETLHQLYKKIEKNKDTSSPSQSKLYRAVNLVVQEHDLKKVIPSSSLSTLTNLSLSHKIYLLSVKGPEQKWSLIKKITDKQLSVRGLREAKKGSQSQKITPLHLINHPERLAEPENLEIVSLEALKKQPPKTLEKIKEKIETKNDELGKEIERLKKSILDYKHYLEKLTALGSDVDAAINFKNNPPPQPPKEKAAKVKGTRKLKEPNIISVSRRTDIPALYSDWLFNRIKDGSVIYRKDTETRPKKVSLTPENVRCFVFWTKNPGPMLNRLDELKGYHYFFHFTLTPYGHNLEPHLPSNEKLIETFIRLSEAIGKQRVIWRYDPILITKTIDADYHRKNFADLAERLHKHTNKCMISFISSLPNISKENKKILQLKKFADDDRLALAKDIYKIAQGYGLRVEACSQKLDYTSVGIPRSRCVDPDLVGTLIGAKFSGKKDTTQRKNCGCAKSVDIGMDLSCTHGCFYCYATHDHEQAKVNYHRHAKTSPLLIGRPEDRDVLIWDIKNNEWTKSKNNVNFSTGCFNNCLYCYGRYMPFARRKEQEAKNQGKKWTWGEPKIREKDAKKKQSLRDGRVGFPTSHDITPDNLDTSLTVLGNLLNAGNEVMIISKPELSCIKAICQAFPAFKNKILFRFTIGGKSEDVLKFWEPKAPTYEERLKALKYAFDADFQTSVSMEPMLEYSRAQEMVDDFMPYVRDAIWFGKMNHIPLFKDPDGRLKEELAKVEAGHADENIKALYEIYKDNPKIKWKLAFKEVLGIPLPPAPGMDI